MILSINEFCQDVALDLNGLIDAVASDVTGRPTTDQEKRAMRSSYPAVASMLRKATRKNPKIGMAHISTNDLLLEYRLPAAPAWCDLVLLGEGYGKKQAVIVELKDWLKNDSDQPGDYEGSIIHQGNPWHHPSDQVKGYVEYCQYFHSAVVDNNAHVTGCVFFTRDIDTKPYKAYPNDSLSEKYPLYNTEKTEELAQFVCDNIENPDEQWASSFVNGYYKQNRNILEQVAQALKNKSNTIRPFVLLDAQRTGFAEVMAKLDACVKSHEKEVIIVEGPPGSGKSAVAVNLWVEAVERYVTNAGFDSPGNVLFVSTSSSQKDNWKDVFLHSGFFGAEGYIMPANAFNPGMTGGKMKEYYVPIFRDIDADKYLRTDVSLKYDYYEDYTNYMVEHGEAKNYHDNHHFLSIVDEAHALINPVVDNFVTNKTGGWCMQMGPQAYHIIRQSRVSVFFADDKQSFRDNETTSINDLEILAKKLGANVTKVSLASMQFRCAGSVDYVDWVDHLFAAKPLLNHNRWKDQFILQVVDNTTVMESALSAYHRDGRVVRILSSYSVEWKSAHDLDAMHSKPAPFDFDFVNEDGTRFQRHWNNPNGYEIFVQATAGSLMHTDPLCEVGCPFVVRGFDFDYIGLLWLSDIVWRNGQWCINLNNTQETANGCSRSSARKELDEELKRQKLKPAQRKQVSLVPLHSSLEQMNKFGETIVQAYRILFTRAVKGVYLYVQDQETREHVRTLLRD